MASKSLCRMCVEEHLPLLDIFGTFGQEQQIREIIAQHFWFEVLENDPLSDKMCTDCWRKLTDFQAFYNLVQKAQDRITMVVIEMKPNDSKMENQIDLVGRDEMNGSDSTIMQEFKMEEEYSNHFEDEESDTIENQSETFERNNVKQDIYIEDSSLELPPQSLENTTSQLENSTDRVDELLDDPEKDLDDTDEIFEDYTQQKTRRKRREISTENSAIENCTSTVENCSTARRRKSSRIKQRVRKPVKRDIDEAQKHKEIELIESYFKMECELCHENIGTFQALFHHYEGAHQFRGFIVCCGKKFFRRTAIAEHVLWHTKPESFTCPECNKIFGNKRCLENHLLTHAPPDMTLYQCEHCTKSFVKKFKLDKHKLSHLTDEEKLYMCEECDKPYASGALLRAHKRVVHQHTYAHMCEICAKVFKSRVFFEKHQLEHLGQNLPKVQCQICEAWMKNEHTMRAHMRNHQDEGQEHECDICGKKGPSRNAIAKHKRFVHLCERKFKCTLCDKAFKRAITLKEHMTVHTGEILYTCTFCPKTFNSGANMHAHRKKSHPCEWFEEKKSKLESLKPNTEIP